MPVPCARCNMPLPKWELASSQTAVCTLCSAVNMVQVFPAVLNPVPQPVRTETALEGEAACFDHPGKRAVAACEQCGRFVCQLCSVSFDDQIWCPSCVAAGAGKAHSARTETTRTLYDSMALILPLASLVIYPLTLLAAPAAVAMSFLRWSRPLSLVRRWRWRFVAAIAIGLTEIGLWTLLIIRLVTASQRGAAG